MYQVYTCSYILRKLTKLIQEAHHAVFTVQKKIKHLSVNVFRYCDSWQVASPNKCLTKLYRVAAFQSSNCSTFPDFYDILATVCKQA